MTKPYAAAALVQEPSGDWIIRLNDETFCRFYAHGRDRADVKRDALLAVKALARGVSVYSQQKEREK